MRRWQAVFPLILLTLLALPALQPLLSADFTCGFDNNFHLWRGVEMGELLRQGILYSRWAPHMAYGYGYPLFLFQSPLSAYVAAIFNLVGLPWATAVNGTFALSLLFSGWAMWLLGRELWGQKGGLVSAVAYLYAPYHAYVLFNRGSLSEALAWVFPPLILWGLRRWQLAQARVGLATAVFSFIAMMLSHDPTTYAFIPLFVAWIIITRVWRLESKPTLQSLISGLLPGFTALGLGIVGSAFFWLPAWLERSHIQFDRVATTWPFRYFDNFLPLEQLLALPRNADLLLLNDWPERGLGVLLLATAVLGFLTALRLKEQRPLALLLALALAGYTFLTLPPAQFIWDAIPSLAAFTPWRFLAPVTLVAAVLSGAVASNWLSRPLILTGVAGVIIALLSVGHWGWFYPDHCSVPKDTTAAGIVRYELATNTVGTTAKQELLPTSVHRLVEPETLPLVWYQRLNSTDAAANVRLIQGRSSLWGDEMIVEAAEPTTVQYRLLYFRGWQVLVDGMAVRVTPSDPEGWLQFEVPDGRHTLTIRFAETPVWLLADWLSVVAVLATVTMSLRGKAEQPKKAEKQGSAASLTGTGKWGNYAVLLVLAVGLLGLKWQVVDRQLVWPRQQQGVVVARPLAFTFGGPNDPGQIRLLGHQAIANNIPVNEPLALSLLWQAVVATSNDYRVGLTLVDENGLRWSEEGLRDDRWSRNPPTTAAWSPDRYVETAYLLDVLPGTPPGQYTLRLSMFDRQTLAPLTIYDEVGQAIGPWLELGQVRLTAPQQPWSDVAMQYEFGACTAVPCLQGSNVDRAEAAPGDQVLVTLFWSANGGDAATLSLVDETETAVANWPLTLPDLPDGLWREQQLIQLPVDLQDGNYQWQITFGDGQSITWGHLQISAPERVLEPPDVTSVMEATLDEQVTLWGATLREEGEELVVELVWRGERPMTESYHVFLHLLGTDGSLIAQSDGVPAGDRPTMGWLPGEYITDVRRLPLPPDNDYSVQVGLYVPNGERLQTADNQDAILLESTD